MILLLLILILANLVLAVLNIEKGNYYVALVPTFIAGFVFSSFLIKVLK